MKKREESMEASRENLMRRLHCSLAAAPSSLPKQQQHLLPPTQQQQQNLFANSFSLLHGDPSSGGAVRGLYSGSLVGFDGNSKSSSNAPPSSIGGGGGDRSSNKRPVGTPPFHPPIPHASPFSQIPTPGRSPGPQSSSQGLGQGHARSLSQPAAFFSLDALPPLSPSSYRESPSGSALSDPTSADMSMDDRDNSSPATATTPPPGPFSRSRSGRMAGGFPPVKAHRRSLSEIPLGFSQPSFSLVVPPLAQKWPQGFVDPPACKRDDLSSAGKKVQGQFLRKDWDWDRGFDKSTEGMGKRKSEADSGEDLLDEYMNLDGQDALNSSGTEEKHEDQDSRASGTKTNGADCSENEAESSVSESVNSLQQLHVNGSSILEKKEGPKRSAVGDPDPNINRSRHLRSVSMDSFMGNMNFGDESPNLPLSPAVKMGQHSHNKSFDGTSNAFSLELGNGEFSSTELNKIMADEKLTDIAVADPKRAKRILANRQSAARSKERKLRYISELEHKVQTLQTEATTMSARLTKLQRDSAGLTSQNNELKFRLQALAQQEQLRDALNEALTAEVRHLKLASQQLTGANSSGSLTHQLPANPQLFPLHQLQQQQQSQLPMYQLQHIQPQQHQQAQLQNQLHQKEDSLETKMRSESVA